MTTSPHSFVRFQAALWEGWTHVIIERAVVCARVVEHQAKILDHPPEFRRHCVMPQGADLLDHYGHRSHDVDVEKL